ncbi:MAG TPA: PD-(D/E)XK motif protein [Mucilaginibacter sp.]|nr:PD-(D/E)XK motif protein [Mucilaginibacter sp.]
MTDLKIWNNPWQSIHKGARRRIDASGTFNFYWVKDFHSKFGMLISFIDLGRQAKFTEKIKGITLIEHLEENSFDLYLILNETDDWQLFESICNDLIQISAACKTNDDLFKSIYSRLKRWQRFLSQGKSFSISEIKQMGLFAELSFLKQVLIEKTNIRIAIRSWVGPDFDKQDFSLANSFVEVKSLISSKGPFIKISSLYQLQTQTKPLFLGVYSLTTNDDGLSILDIIAEIALMFTEQFLVKEEFENKLAQFGYIDGVTEPPFYKWKIDKVEFYNVFGDFPRIVSSSVPGGVIAAEYMLDLSKCDHYLITENELIF